MQVGNSVQGQHKQGKIATPISSAEYQMQQGTLLRTSKRRRGAKAVTFGKAPSTWASQGLQSNLGGDSISKTPVLHHILG
eukprot:1160121-Pelagomonas_calceolata.AAC.6